MYIKIAPGVQVYITNEQLAFINKYKNYKSFRNSDLDIIELETAKVLAAKSIFVRKKLDNDVQYALNRHIRFVNNNDKKT
jgi:hypothetical protein